MALLLFLFMVGNFGLGLDLDCMIMGLSNNGLGEDAIDLFGEFKQKGLRPDGQLFVTKVNSFNKHVSTDLWLVENWNLVINTNVDIGNKQQAQQHLKDPNTKEGDSTKEEAVETNEAKVQSSFPPLAPKLPFPQRLKK